MNYQLASAIIKGKWAIDPMFAMNASGLVADILNGNVDVEAPMMASKRINSGGGSSNPGAVGVINISGSLMKNDQDCGPVGMGTMANWVKAFDADPGIDAIVLKIDSPGGTVDGTQLLADAVKNAQKPVVSFVDGLMASAALWIGSSADEVFASSDIDEVGSVGVLMSFMDIQPYYESLGVKFHTIVASQSPDKRKMYEDLRAGKYEEYRNEFLDPIAEKFIAAVKENRPNVKDEHLTGKVFMAKNVMDVFVDKIGSFEDAITRALELAEEQEETAAKDNPAAKTDMYMKYGNIEKALGIESMEFEADGRRTFTTEEMEAVETALAENDNDSLQSELDAANRQIEELTEQVEALTSAPGAEITDTTEATDDAVVADSDDLTAEDINLFNSLKR